MLGLVEPPLPPPVVTGQDFAARVQQALQERRVKAQEQHSLARASLGAGGSGSGDSGGGEDASGLTKAGGPHLS